MVIIFFSVIAIEAGRLYINITMYANRNLSSLDNNSVRAQSIMARIGIALDIAALAITGFMIVLTFGSFSAILLAFAAVGYARSIVHKQRVLVTINRLNPIS